MYPKARPRPKEIRWHRHDCECQDCLLWERKSEHDYDLWKDEGSRASDSQEARRG